MDYIRTKMTPQGEVVLSAEECAREDALWAKSNAITRMQTAYRTWFAQITPPAVQRERLKEALQELDMQLIRPLEELLDPNSNAEQRTAAHARRAEIKAQKVELRAQLEKLQ